MNKLLNSLFDNAGIVRRLTFNEALEIAHDANKQFNIDRDDRAMWNYDQTKLPVFED
jgi:hypothetical protein